VCSHPNLVGDNGDIVFFSAALDAMVCFLGHNQLRTLGVALSICLATVSAQGEERVSYAEDIAPLLEEHCTACHGSDNSEARLNLESLVDALRGGNSGEPTVVPGHSNRSYLIGRVTTMNAAERMPPDSDRLSDREIDLLRRWVDQADDWREAEESLGSQRSEHWSFQPVIRPAVPDMGAAYPIDAFIAVRLAEAGLGNSEAASRRKKIRRLFLVMHGLPPTPKRVLAFVNDKRPNAWELLVDEVLAGPQYGERWATFWLDLVRFAETDGYETNRERPNAWHYRDWVIRAFNEDKPYDQFITEQLAGDAHGEDAATGFLVAGPHDIVKGKDKQLGLIQRQDELDGIINTTGATFLGLSLGCARCHNHKFDPILQKDYYSMQAVFAGVTYANRPLPVSLDREGQLARLDEQINSVRNNLPAHVRNSQMLSMMVDNHTYVESFPRETARFVRFNINECSGAEPCLDELEIFSDTTNVGLSSAGAHATSSGDLVHPLHKLKHINDGKYGNAYSWIASSSLDAWVQIEFAKPAEIDRVVWSRDRLGQYKDRLAIEYDIQFSNDGKQWKTVVDTAGRSSDSSAEGSDVFGLAKLPDEVTTSVQKQIDDLKALIARREKMAQPENVWAGQFKRPGPTHRLYRGDPMAPREQVEPGAIVALTSLSLPADAPEQSRRLAVAEWIADSENPLTARVMVNRIWQHHFGQGIVDTPSDFGTNGVAPSHPLLLDWLAAEFVESGWSVKHMQKLILTSDTWQQGSIPNAKAMTVDAGSRLLWRFPHRRLEAEGIRDSVLAVTGYLNPQASGPGFSGFEVSLENVRHYFPKKSFGDEDWRRMIYMTKVRQERDSVFGTFDVPDCSQLVAKRSRSTTPMQAMGLLNSQFMIEQARYLADRLAQETDAPAARIERAYELCFGRAPDENELQLAAEMIDASSWNEFARAMLNANEFVFIP
jgi:mono/diheme cytochrome c family protein